jgi:hypothetical protein
MGAILHAGVGVNASVVAAALFVAVSTSGLLTMLGYELLAPESARARLDALRSWLESHRRSALTLVAGVAGAWLAIAGLIGLVHAG